MNVTLVTAVAALITSIATFILIFISKRQLRFNRFALAVESVLKLDERFEKEFIAKRKTAAIALKT